MNGPNENAKKNLSSRVTPAAEKICSQLLTIWSQLSRVSTQRIGTVVVPLVWWHRVYRSNGYVRSLP